MIKKFVLFAVIGVLMCNCAFACDCEIVHKSIRFYEKQVKENPGDVCSMYNLANEYRLKNKIQKALDTYEEIIVIDPKEEKAYRKKTYIYETYYNQRQAEREYGRLVKNIPDSVYGNTMISYVYYNISDYESALKHTNKAIELSKDGDIDQIWNFYFRADIYREMGRYKEAIEDYTRFAEQEENFGFDAYYDICECYKKLGDTAKAEEAEQKWKDGWKTHKYKKNLIEDIKQRSSKFKAKFYVNKLR